MKTVNDQVREFNYNFLYAGIQHNPVNVTHLREMYVVSFNNMSQYI